VAVNPAVGHPSFVGRRRSKAARVLGGSLLMVGSVLIALAILVRFAGDWGVPYFSFTTDRGSVCRNDLVGYTCTRVTVADINFYADVDLPAQTQVVEARYHATHDYQLDANLAVPRAQSGAALKVLRKSYGRCQPGHPSLLDGSGVKSLCVMANDEAGAMATSETSRVFVVATGVTSAGVRRIVMTVKSR
jgi:hypothetical protein